MQSTKICNNTLLKGMGMMQKQKKKKIGPKKEKITREANKTRMYALACFWLIDSSQK